MNSSVATAGCVKALGFLRHIPNTEGSPGGLILFLAAAGAALVLGGLALWLFFFTLVGPSDD